MREQWTQSGGIDVRSKDGRREWSVEWDKDGKLVRESCVIHGKGKGKKKSCCSKKEKSPKQEPPKPRKPVAPGDWFACLVVVVTLGYVQICATCKSRRASANKAGWRGLPRLWWSTIFHRGNG